MSRADELVASLYLVGYIVPTIFVALRISSRWSDDGLDRTFLAVLVGLTQAIGVPLVVAMLGVLNRSTVLAGHLVLAVATLALVSRQPKDQGPARSGFSAGALTSIGTAVAFVTLSVWLDLRSPSLHFDTRNYHLSHLADWLQGHSFWSFGFSLPAQYTVAYPSNGEFLGLWFALPTHGDQFSLLSPILFAVLGILAVAVLTRELGGEPWIGALAGTAVFATPLLFGSQTRSLGTDNAAAAGVAAAAAFVACALRKPDQRRWVVAAGIGLGLGMGSKYTALVPGAAVVLAAIWLLRRPGRLVWLLPGLLFFLGPWLLRNVIETGNPLFPQGITIGGVELLQGSKYPLSPASAPLIEHIVKGRWSIVGRWLGHVGWWLGPVALLTVIGFFSGLKRKSSPARVWSLVALAGFIGYLFTPFTGGEVGGRSALLLLNLRYVLPALLIGTALAAALGGRVCALLVFGALLYDAARILTGNSATRFNGLVVSAAVAIVVLAVAAMAVLIAARWPTVTARMSTSSRAPIVIAATLALAGAWAGTAFVLHRVNTNYASLPLESLLARAGNHRTVEVIGAKDLRGLLGRRLDVHLQTPFIPPDSDGSRERLDSALRSTDARVLVVSALPTFGVPRGYTPPSGWCLFGRVGDDSVYLRSATCVPAASG